jgi:hypothetical protein
MSVAFSVCGEVLVWSGRPRPLPLTLLLILTLIFYPTHSQAIFSRAMAAIVLR